jgi:drug/metabolite transporter (DMT)-like permease
MVIAAATTFALNGTGSKLLMQGGFDPPQLTTFRAAGAFLGLLMFILATQGPRPLKAHRQELPRLIIFGLVGFFLVPMLYFVAISRLPVGIGLLFEFTAPAFVALWVRFGEHQQVRRRLWVGLGLCLAGLASVTQIWAGKLTLDGLGILAGLTSAVLLAVFYVLGSKTVATRNPLSLTCWAFGVSAVAGAVVRPWWTFDAGLLLRSSGGYPMWLLGLYLIIPGTIVPYLLITYSMRHLPPTSVGIVSMTEVVLASAFAWVLLNENLNPAQVIGGSILVAGVILAESARVVRGPRNEDRERTGPSSPARVVRGPRNEDRERTGPSSPARVVRGPRNEDLERTRTAGATGPAEVPLT